jgi:hypothetical protein
MNPIENKRKRQQLSFIATSIANKQKICKLAKKVKFLIKKSS